MFTTYQHVAGLSGEEEAFLKYMETSVPPRRFAAW